MLQSLATRPARGIAALPRLDRAAVQHHSIQPLAQRIGHILDRLAVSISHEDQISLHQALLREVMTDLPMLPLYWKIDPILVAKGVSGVKGRFTSNIFEWDKK